MLKYTYPFPKDIEIRARKPPEGRYVHENHPESRYAIDFLLPLGTPVIASCEGKVVLLNMILTGI